MNIAKDIMGNDEEYEKLLFKEFEIINEKKYAPLSEDNVGSIVGKYKKGLLGFENDMPDELDEIVFTSDGKIFPDNEMSAWKHYGHNIVMIYYPYEALPEYDLEAGVEEQAKYVFMATDGSSMILSNSDGSVREIFIRS